MIPTDLKIGDLCVTINSKVPLLNEGHLVVILEINPGYRSFHGQSLPFLIRRLDGQVFSSTFSGRTGQHCWARHKEVWAARHHLMRLHRIPDTHIVEQQINEVQP